MTSEPAGGSDRCRVLPLQTLEFAIDPGCTFRRQPDHAGLRKLDMDAAFGAAVTQYGDVIANFLRK